MSSSISESSWVCPNGMGCREALKSLPDKSPPHHLPDPAPPLRTAAAGAASTRGGQGGARAAELPAGKFPALGAVTHPRAGLGGQPSPRPPLLRFPGRRRCSCSSQHVKAAPPPVPPPPHGPHQDLIGSVNPCPCGVLEGTFPS